MMKLTRTQSDQVSALQMMQLLRSGADERHPKVDALRDVVREPGYVNELKLAIVVEKILVEIFPAGYGDPV